MTLSLETALVLRDQLRSARARVHDDAEAFREVVVVIERLGLVLTGRDRGLKDLLAPLRSLVQTSALTTEIPEAYPLYHPEFNTLYDQVREGRNSAIHDGAFARHLADRTVELSLIFEDALQAEAMKIQHYMIRDPVTAAMWEPISFVRQKMLANSFSFLPLLATGDKWMLVSDRGLAGFLRTVNGTERKKRLKMALEQAVEPGIGLQLEAAERCAPDDMVADIASRIGDRPILVLEHDAPTRLLGIVTAFDLL